LILISSLSILTIVMFVVSISIGPAILNPVEVLQAIFLKPFGYTVEDTVATISMLRLSRALASLFCGASLALAGLLMQTITRNPLADPYIFGLSSTALTVVAIGIILAPTLMIYKHFVVVMSFVGAMMGYLLTLFLSKLGGGSSLAMVLAGIAVASLFSGVSHILLYIVQRIIRTPYVYPLMGSVSTVLQKDIPFLVIPTITLTALTIALFKTLNAYLYGDEYAKQLGFNPKLIRDVFAFIAAFLTAITIAFVGIVGFIGLAAPHIARFLVGSDHRFSIPITVLVGAQLTLVADIVVKLISMYAGAVGELPLGVVTAVIGAPFLSVPHREEGERMKIVVKGVEVWYNSTQALKNISFEVREGEVTFVIGPNGAGKSSLLKTIAHIVKPRVGVVYIDGKAVSMYSPKDLGKIMAYVDPQISRSIPSTVLEFLITARCPHQSLLSFRIPRQDLEVIERISKQLNIEHLLNRRLDQLSSGEFQRIVIARALVQSPKVLLLGEPSAFLDLRYRLEILDYIRKITQQNKTVSVVAIHDLYLASLYADKVIVLDSGEIVAIGTPDEVFNRELLEKVYKVKITILNVYGKKIVIPIEPLEKIEVS